MPGLRNDEPPRDSSLPPDVRGAQWIPATECFRGLTVWVDLVAVGRGMGGRLR